MPVTRENVEAAVYDAFFRASGNEVRDPDSQVMNDPATNNQVVEYVWEKFGIRVWPIDTQTVAEHVSRVAERLGVGLPCDAPA